MVLGFRRACRGRQIEAEDLYGLGLAVLERRKAVRLSLQSGNSSEQLQGPELIAPSLSLCCVPGFGGGAHVGQNFRQGPNTSAIFRSCRARGRGLGSSFPDARPVERGRTRAISSLRRTGTAAAMKCPQCWWQCWGPHIACASQTDTWTGSAFSEHASLPRRRPPRQR